MRRRSLGSGPGWSGAVSALLWRTDGDGGVISSGVHTRPSLMISFLFLVGGGKGQVLRRDREAGLPCCVAKTGRRPWLPHLVFRLMSTLEGRRRGWEVSVLTTRDSEGWLPCMSPNFATGNARAPGSQCGHLPFHISIFFSLSKLGVHAS